MDVGKMPTSSGDHHDSRRRAQYGATGATAGLNDEENGEKEREAERDGTMPFIRSDERSEESPRGGSNNRVIRHLTAIYKSDPLLVLTIVGVVIGVIFGLILQAVLPEEAATRDTAVRIVGFPGAILLNLLKMMVLPLIAGSMIGGVCALNEAGAATGKLATKTLLYFGVTTVIAVFLGLIMVQLIRPGVGGMKMDQPVASTPTTTQTSMTETILGVILKMFPPNIVKAAVEMNVLGIITFSLFFGVMLSRIGAHGAPMIALVHVFNEVIMQMVHAILWLAPFGIASLISSQIASTSNLGTILQALGKYCATVVFCLMIHGGIILPGIYYAITKRDPWIYMRGMAQALATAFGTDSSSATLPVTMMCCERNNGVNPLISKFVLPLGATVNMNGTALYEALTVIFIAQLHGVDMNVGQLLVVAFTSTLAAVGAAAIPSAGLVTMVMVLQSVNLDEYVTDLSIIFTIDWALDRVRTMVNVLGDAYGAGIVHHLCGEEVAASSSSLDPSSRHHLDVSDGTSHEREPLALHTPSGKSIQIAGPEDADSRV